MSDSWGYKIEDPVKYENLRIIDVLRDIGSGNMVLPPIQRKAVWKEKQITDFFDSILRGYPLNNFLFWRLKKSFVNARKMSLYKFLTVYDVFCKPFLHKIAKYFCTKLQLLFAQSCSQSIAYETILR